MVYEVKKKYIEMETNKKKINCAPTLQQFYKNT